MSYKELPIHLKPCFLYMGVFQEDREIHVPELIKLWVAEGFLKPINSKSLELVAAECFNELIDRNFITVHKLGSNGKTKFCKVHDLLRDLSLKEAQKQRFLCVTRLRDLNCLQHVKTERRIVIHEGASWEIFDHLRLYNYLQSASHVRSLIVEYKSYDLDRVLQSTNLRLLRVLKVNHEREYYNHVRLDYKLYNLRYFSSNRAHNPASLSPRLYWNMQTLVGRGSYDFSEFWEMPLLRHVHEHTIFSIPNPPIDRRDVSVFGNLQTLSQIRLSACRAEVFERIPNTNKLKIFCEEDDRRSLHFLNNLGHLHKLEHLNCICLLMQEPIRSILLQNLTFPRSLKKLTLCGCLLHWEDITTKIGPLPLLEVLKLKTHSFIGPEWETVEDQFCSLKFLLIDRCYSLQHWTTESTHFPRLEHLVLGELHELKEIPWDIGEIPTLQSIKLKYCSDSAVISAKRILEEQLELGNEGLKVEII